MAEVAITDSLLKLPSLGHYLRQDGLGFVHWLDFFFLFSKIPNVELKCEMLEMVEQLCFKCKDTFKQDCVLKWRSPVDHASFRSSCKLLFFLSWNK